MALPATKANDLINELASIFDNNQSLDEFSLRRYQKDINAIKRIDHSHGSLLEAFIAGIQNDTPRVLHIAEDGVSKMSGESAWYKNISMLLRKLGRITDAYAVVLAGLQRFPSEPILFQDAMYFALVHEDVPTITRLENEYPGAFYHYEHTFSGLSVDTPDEEIVRALNNSINADSDPNWATALTPREVDALEELLNGVEIE